MVAAGAGIIGGVQGWLRVGSKPIAMMVPLRGDRPGEPPDRGMALGGPIPGWLYSRRRLLAGVLLGIISLALYTVTLAPDILAHDVADWQAAAATGGISHPPGSPAYILFAWIFTLVPIGSIPERVNFLSAVVGAIGVVALYAFVLMLFDSMLPAIVAAASLMVAAQWWSYASVAQPYNSVLTINAIFLVLLLLWQKHGDIRLIYLGALLSGFGLAWHPTVMYFLPALIAGIFIFGPWRKLLALLPLSLTLLCLVLGLSFFLYLPIRSAADPPIKYAQIDSWSSFGDFVTDSQSRSSSSLSMPQWEQFKEIMDVVVRKGYFPSYAFLVFGPAILLLYRGLWPRLTKQKRMLFFLLVVMVLHIGIAGIAASSSMKVASSVQYTQYYMPLLLYFTIWVGLSVYLLMATANVIWVGRYGHVFASLTAAIYLGVLALGISHVWNFVDHSDDRTMRELTDKVFETAQPGANVIANWEAYTGLLFAQVVDSQRPDVTLTDVPQEGWQAFLPGAGDISRQALYAATLPVSDPGNLQVLSDYYYLSFKGRTYKDRSHGKPYALTVQLFQVLGTTG